MKPVFVVDRRERVTLPARPRTRRQAGGYATESELIGHVLGPHVNANEEGFHPPLAALVLPHHGAAKDHRVVAFEAHRRIHHPVHPSVA